MNLIEAIKQSDYKRAVSQQQPNLYAYYDEGMGRFCFRSNNNNYNAGLNNTGIYLNYIDLVGEDWQPYQKTKEKKVKVYEFPALNCLPSSSVRNFVQFEVCRKLSNDTRIKMTLEWEE